MIGFLEPFANALKAVFYVIIPGLLVFARIKGKLSTGFMLGAMITSILLGLIVVGSAHRDPVDTFMEQVNARQFDDARKSYKILVQFGESHLDKVNEEKIIYKEEFNAMKNSIYTEYIQIAEKNNEKVTVDSDAGCSSLPGLQKNMADLHHALKMLDYAALIGDDRIDMRKSVKEKLQSSTRLVEKLKKRCL